MSKLVFFALLSFVLFGIICLIVSCSITYGDEQENRRQELQRLTSSIIYFKDNKSGFCFAKQDGWRYTSITNVPCVGIEHLLEK